MTKKNLKMSLVITGFMIATLGLWLFPRAGALASGDTKCSNCSAGYPDETDTGATNFAVSVTKDAGIAEANNRHLLTEDEFAIIERKSPKPAGKKVKQAVSLKNGEKFEFEIDGNSSFILLEGDKEGKTYVSLSQDVRVNYYEDQYPQDEKSQKGKIDPRVRHKLAKEKKSGALIPVIIQLNLPFEKFYERGQNKVKIAEKKEKFKKAKTNVEGLMKRGKGKLKHELKIINGLSASVDEDSLKALEESPEVKRVELDGKVRMVLDTSLDEIKAREVWSLPDPQFNPITGAGKRIAIIDTGVDYAHPDLGGCFGPSCKVIAGYDFVNDDPDPMDDQGHGTHVAATAAGDGALQGVAPEAKILAYKVLSAQGKGEFSDVISAIDYATDPNRDGNPADHVDVANMSLGGGGNPDDAVCQAVDNSTAAGVVHAIAAGNSGPSVATVGSPGIARTAITVAAACKTAQIGVDTKCITPIADFSSRGPVIWNGVDLQKPDIAAPGRYICAARWQDAFPTAPTCMDIHHVRISGTSMATPHIAGVVALVRQAYPAYTPAQVKELLKNTARNLGLSYDIQGAGMADLQAAIPIIPVVNANPKYWPLTTDPTVKLSSQQQLFSITPTVTSINTLTLAFQSDAPGINVSFNKPLLQVANQATDTFQATLTVDNDLVKGGRHRVTVLLSEGGVVKGFIFVYLTVNPTLVTSPDISQMLDYGIDDPSLSTWVTDIKPITVTNLRKDIAQTISISAQGYPTGATFQIPSSLTISANGSSTFNTQVTVNNAQVANKVYTGFLALNNQANTITFAAKFIKFYVLDIEEETMPMIGDYLILHDRNYAQLGGPLVKRGVAYLSSLGTYDIVVEYWNYKTGFTEGISVNQGYTYVLVSRNTAAKNLVRIVPVDHNGLPIQGHVSGTYHLQFRPFASPVGYPTLKLLGGGPGYIISEVRFSDVSNNYAYRAVGSWPNFYNPSKDVDFFHATFNALTGDLTFTNTASDFKIMDVQLNTDQQTGQIDSSIYPQVMSEERVDMYSNTCLLPAGSGLLNVPLTRRIYSLLPADIYSFVATDNPVSGWANVMFGYQTVYSPYFTTNSQRWLGYEPAADYPALAPIEGNKVYVGLGPSYWAIRFQNSANAIKFYPYFQKDIIGYLGQGPAFLRQDYSGKKYDAVPFDVYDDSNTIVANGNLPVFAPDYSSYPVVNTLPSLTLTQSGWYEVRLNFPYKNKGLEMMGKVKARFNTALTDPNPPAIRRLYFYTGNLRSEIYDSAVANRLEFELDPVGGTMGVVGAGYALDGINFTPLTVSTSARGYSADIPQGLNVSKLTLQITGVDNSQNSLSYTFELPPGTIPSRDNTPPAVPVVTDEGATTYKLDQIYASWNSYDYDSGIAEYQYRITQDSTSGTVIRDWVSTGTANYITAGGLSLINGKSYYFGVKAKNEAGLWSNVGYADGITIPPLKAPFLLIVSTVSASQINLSWLDNSADKTGFKIERSLDNLTFSQIANVPGNLRDYSDKGLSADTTYYYRVITYMGTAPIGYSRVASATTLAAFPPTEPSHLIVSAASASQINLSWLDSSTNEAGFKIERSLDGSIFTQVTTVGANVSSYSNTGLNASTLYYYRVCAYNNAGNSGYSNTASVTTLAALPAAPSGLAASAASASQINLSWTDNSANESGFKLERSIIATSGFTQIADLPANTTAYTDTGLTPNTKYYYRVFAYNSGGSSAYSNSVFATTFNQVPYISSISPASGSRGTRVTIMGLNFSSYIADPSYNPNADANNDGKVDLADLVMLARSFNFSVGSPDYNRNADFNNDGKVDMADLGMLGRSYGSGRGTNYVKFYKGTNGYEGKVVSWTAAQIVCEVPYRAVTGKGTVRVTTDQGTSDPIDFTVN